jgi:SWI/SNF-related matrix-associated actin-dependent regulator 1 of chromatin subfamily A
MAQLMLKEPTHSDANPNFIFEDMEIMHDFELGQLCNKYNSLKSFRLKDSHILDSGKLKVLDELLPSLQEQKVKVLIFSQFIMVLDILETYLNIRKYKFLRLDGSTKIEDRLDLIDDFNSPSSETFIFLLTTRAGGVGINLTAASTAIIHDIDFNPYNDKQAEDRCHRVGQTRDVTIYKLVTPDSIEEGMLKMQNDKLKLGEDLCDSSRRKGGKILLQILLSQIEMI